jgi:hypothetical protein
MYNVSYDKLSGAGGARQPWFELYLIWLHKSETNKRMLERVLMSPAQKKASVMTVKLYLENLYTEARLHINPF